MSVETKNRAEMRDCPRETGTSGHPSMKGVLALRADHENVIRSFIFAYVKPFMECLKVNV